MSFFLANAQLFHPSHGIENKRVAPVIQSVQYRSVSRNTGIANKPKILKIGKRDIHVTICDTTHKNYN